MVKRMHHFLFLLSLAAIFTFCHGIAWAEWSGPVNVSNTETYSQHPNIATDSQNNIHITWADGLRPSAGEQFKREILYVKNISGNWSQPKNISKSKQKDSRHPHIVIDRNDTIHEVWFEVGENSNICYSYKKKGTRWSEKKLIRTQGHSCFPIIAIGGKKVHAAWEERFKNGIAEIFYAKYLPSKDIWTSPKNISKLKGKSEHPFVAVDSEQKIHVVWSCLRDNQKDIYYSNNREGIWSEPENISFDSSGGSKLPIIAYANNKLSVVWAEQFSDYSDVLFKEKDLVGSWSDPFGVSVDSNIFSRTPFLAVHKEYGNVHVVWTEQDFGSVKNRPPDRIYYRARLNGEWSESVCLTCNETERCVRPVVSVGADGIHVAYRGYIRENGEFDIFYMFKPN